MQKYISLYETKSSAFPSSEQQILAGLFVSCEHTEIAHSGIDTAHVDFTPKL